MRYLIKHITSYKYSQRVTRCYNVAYVVPRNTDRQQCLKNHISISPQPTVVRKRRDYFGNKSCHFEIQKPHKELIISVESEVEINQLDSDIGLDLGITFGELGSELRASTKPETMAAREYLLDSTAIERHEDLAEYARPSFDPEQSLKFCVRDLTTRIFTDFSFDPHFTTIATPLLEVLQHKRGVCQDFAHLQIGCLRSMGIPARYVSGYIETIPAVGTKKLVGADATHAWLAYYSPDEGWVEFDPTNNKQADSQHIVTAFGRDYFDVTPVRGVIFGGGSSPILDVSVDVARIGQDS